MTLLVDRKRNCGNISRRCTKIRTRASKGEGRIGEYPLHPLRLLRVLQHIRLPLRRPLTGTLPVHFSTPEATEAAVPLRCPRMPHTKSTTVTISIPQCRPGFKANQTHTTIWSSQSGRCTDRRCITRNLYKAKNTAALNYDTHKTRYDNRSFFFFEISLTGSTGRSRQDSRASGALGGTDATNDTRSSAEMGISFFSSSFWRHRRLSISLGFCYFNDCFWFSVSLHNHPFGVGRLAPADTPMFLPSYVCVGRGQGTVGKFSFVIRCAISCLSFCAFIVQYHYPPVGLSISNRLTKIERHLASKERVPLQKTKTVIRCYVVFTAALLHQYDTAHLPIRLTCMRRCDKICLGTWGSGGHRSSGVRCGLSDTSLENNFRRMPYRGFLKTVFAKP